jgi:CysZ protein
MRKSGGPRPSVAREFFAGVSLLGHGLRLWLTQPRLMLIGAIPALIVAAVYLAGIIVLAVNLGTVSAWATPFADEWAEPYRGALRITATLAVSGIAVLLIVYTFTAVTLAVGEPFYEQIWRHVEEDSGGLPSDAEAGFWRSLWRGIRSGLVILAVTSLIGLALFLCGFIPIVGQTLVPVLGVAFGGWFLMIELTGLPFEARGRSLRERRRMLGAQRARSLGFGVATYLLFLIPLGPVIGMPAAVAGATLLSRDALASAGALEPKPA